MKYHLSILSPMRGKRAAIYIYFFNLVFFRHFPVPLTHLTPDQKKGFLFPLSNSGVDSLNAVFTLYTINAWLAAYFVITLTVHLFLPTYVRNPASGIFHRPLPFTVTAQIHTGLTHPHARSDTHTGNIQYRYIRSIFAAGVAVLDVWCSGR